MRRGLVSLLTRIKGNVNANAPAGAALTEMKKFFTSEGETRPYVSGRCVKYCIKQQLREKEKEGIDLSPLTRERRVLRSEGNPIDYVDDDLFGYLIPAEERKRFAVVKSSGIVSLRHSEITRDFAGRFDPEGKEYPSPFEEEVADFIGRNDWILTDRVGKFKKDEVKKKMAKSLGEPEDGTYYLPLKKRRSRLREFLNVLLKDRYTFPRSATGLHQPEYYYAFIALTERQLPLFSFVDYKSEEGKVLPDYGKLEGLTTILNDREKIILLDYRGEAEEAKNEKVEVRKISKLEDTMKEILDYLVSEEK